MLLPRPVETALVHAVLCAFGPLAVTPGRPVLQPSVLPAASATTWGTERSWDAPAVTPGPAPNTRPGCGPRPTENESGFQV